MVKELKSSSPAPGASASAPATDSAAPAIGRRTWWEIAPVVGLFALVYQVEARLFWPHGWIRIPWGDWAAHAYRARFLDRWGLVNWSPDWDAGLPLFQAYQMGPHILTVALARLADVSITHSMMIWTSVMVLYPVAGYLFLRLAGVGPWGALLGGVLLFDAASVGPPIMDFSYLFGMAMLPALFWFAVRGMGTGAGYLGAILLGISPYFHPYASIAGVALILVRLVADRFRVNRHVLLQGLIVVLLSSFYWLPYFVSAQPAYIDPWNWSVDFAREVFARNGYWGLSLGVVAASGLTVLALAAGRIRQRRLVLCGLGGAAVLGLMAFLHLRGLLPREVMSIEPSRWMPMVSALLALAAAPLGDALAAGLRCRAASGGRKPVAVGLTLLLLVGVGAAAVEGTGWYQRATIPIGDELGFGDEFEQWASRQPDLPPQVMVWAAPDDIAYTSYFSFGRAQFTGDYIVTRQWTVASPPLIHAMRGWGEGAPAFESDFTPAERYLRMFGVQYVVLREGWPGNEAYVTGALAGRLKIVGRVEGGSTATGPIPPVWIAEVPWQPVRAFTAPLDALRPTTLPDLEFLEYEEALLRDRRIDAFNALKYSGASKPASMTWQSPTRLIVEGDARPGDALVVPQNWDTVWTAEANGKPLRVERTGPNFFAVDLGGLSGPVSIEIEHGPYPTWTAALWMMAAGLLLALVAFLLDATRRRRARRAASERRTPGR